MNRRTAHRIFLGIAVVSTLGCVSEGSIRRAIQDSAAQKALPQKAPGRYVETFEIDGVTRKFILRVPKAYDGTKPLPVVMVLHGWTGSAELAEVYTGMAEKAEKEGFILVSPDGLGQPKGWNVGFMDLSGQRKDDVKFLESVLDRVEKQVGVDPSRIYIAGHSNGAMLAHAAGARLGKRIAAIAAVAGTIGLPNANGGVRTIPDPISPISVMIVHGTADATVAYDDSSRSLLKGLGAPTSAKWWAEKIGAKGPNREKAFDGKVTLERFTEGKAGTMVSFVSIADGSHDWPGGLSRSGTALAPVKATDLIWEFFKSNPKRED